MVLLESRMATWIVFQSKNIDSLNQQWPGNSLKKIYIVVLRPRCKKNIHRKKQHRDWRRWKQSDERARALEGMSEAEKKRRRYS